MAAKKRLAGEELEAYLDKIEALPRFDLSPAEAAPLLGVDSYSLNLAADTGRLGSIEHVYAGRNLRLSKASVLKFCGR